MNNQQELADLLKIIEWLAVTKTPPYAIADAFARLRERAGLPPKSEETAQR
jgi:hypothetical protein